MERKHSKLLILGALGLSLAVEVVLGWRLAIRGLVAAEGHGGAIIYQYYELAAIIVFSLSQAVALDAVRRGSERFFGWAVPPALFAIAVGIITWWRYGVSWLFFSHTLRGFLVLGAAMVHLKALERERPGDGPDQSISS